MSARPSRGERGAGGRPLLGRPREKPSPAQGGGPLAPSAALRPAPGPPLGPFVALRKSRPDCRARSWAFPGLSRRPGRWGENGCAKTSLKTTPGPAALGAAPLPYPGHGRLGSRVWCARRGRGGKEPASTDNQVLSGPSGHPGEAPEHRRAWTASGRVSEAGRKEWGDEVCEVRWGRAAVTVQRRNHGQRPPGWEEPTGRPHLRTLLARQARVSTLTACGSQLCPAKLCLFQRTGKQSWTSSLSYRTLSRRESSRGLRTAGTEGVS